MTWAYLLPADQCYCPYSPFFNTYGITQSHNLGLTQNSFSQVQCQGRNSYLEGNAWRLTMRLNKEKKEHGLAL
jgi:hypothetical protein